MKCIKCGSDVPESNETCNYCGNSMKTQQRMEKVQESLNQNKKQEPQKKKSIVPTIVAIVVFVGFSIYGAITDKGVQKNEEALTALETGTGYEQAYDAFGEALSSVTSDEDKVEILKNWGYAYLADGKVEESKQKFQEALTMVDENSFNYYLVSGEIALADKSVDDALNFYNKAFELEPNDFQINSTMGVFYLGLDEETASYADYEKAFSHNKKAYDENPLSETMMENLALSHFYLNDFESAIDLLLNTSLQNKPYNNFLLGLCYYSIMEDDNAKKYFQTAIDQGYEVPQEVNDFLAYEQ